MAKKTETQQEASEGLLVKAAKKIGKAAGKVAGGKAAPSADAAPEAAPAAAAPAERPHAKSTKVPKLAKSNKSRLPRRQKKAQRKLANA